MKKPIAALLLLNALLGSSALSPAAYAQADAPLTAQAQSPAQAAPDRPRRLPSERIEARLAYLKTALKITPAQEPQWNALANVLRQQARERDTEIQQRRNQRQAQSQQPPTAIERLQRRQHMLATAADRMNAIVTTAGPLYATLSSDQKKIADDMLDHGARHGHWR